MGGGCRPVHAHDVVRMRVMKAITEASQEITTMIVEQGDGDRNEVYAEVEEIIIRHSYYGDTARHGPITEEERILIDAVREFRERELTA